MIAHQTPQPRPQTVSRVIPTQPSRRTRTFLWVFSVVMVLTAGSAFLIKLIEFLYQFSQADNAVGQHGGLKRGFIFAISPLLTYLIVATGFACLFVWSYLSGHFKNVEGPKYRMLELQQQIDNAERESSCSNATGI